MIEVRDITVKYGECEVLRDVSLSLNEGSIIALLGANGAGKTTLIRALNGTLPLASGEIDLDGKDLSSLSRREIAENIAVVAQENETRFPVTVLAVVLRIAAVPGDLGLQVRDRRLALVRAGVEQRGVARIVDICG